nr:hypothetical protein [Tanacetum cinerariifolium]
MECKRADQEKAQPIKGFSLIYLQRKHKGCAWIATLVIHVTFPQSSNGRDHFGYPCEVMSPNKISGFVQLRFGQGHMGRSGRGYWYCSCVLQVHRKAGASDSDNDPLPYAPYAGWEMVPSPLGSIHAYYDIERHTKHFTSLRELLHMVEKNDLRRLLGAIDNLYQKEEPDTFALLLWGDFHVHVLETVDGWVIHMFVDVSYLLSAATLQRMLKHGLEVLKLLVGGDLTMAEQLVSFIKATLLTAQSTA